MFKPSNVIKSPKRLEGEKWEEYFKRRILEAMVIKRWLKGRPHKKEEK